MNDVPLIRKTDVNDINTSLIAIKKQLKQLNEAVGLIDVPDVDLTPFVRKDEVVNVVESGNMNPITSNAVAEYTVDEVTSGNMNPVTSNAVANVGKLTALYNGIFSSQREYSLNLTNYRGLYICIKDNEITKYENYTMYIAKELLSSSKKRFWTSSFWQSASSNFCASMLISLTTIEFGFADRNGAVLTQLYADVYGVS